MSNSNNFIEEHDSGYEWPYNLIAKMLKREDITDIMQNPDCIDGFFYLFYQLDKNKRDIIELYYKDYLTVHEISEVLDLNVKTVVNLRNDVHNYLSDSRNSRFFEDGLNASIVVNDAFMNKPIIYMDLSVATHNAVGRCGFLTVKDVFDAIDFSNTDPFWRFNRVRGFGPKALEELKECLMIIDYAYVNKMTLPEAKAIFCFHDLNFKKNNKSFQLYSNSLDSKIEAANVQLNNSGFSKSMEKDSDIFLR